MTMGFRIPDHQEQIKPGAPETRAFDPDRRLDVMPVLDHITDFFNPDSRIECLYTSREDRINQAKGTDGIWSGEPGNSRVRPNLETADGRAAYEKLAEYGQKDIRFRDGVVDFIKVSVESVTIDKMTSDITKNRGEALKALAEKWNSEGHAQEDGSKWTPDAVGKWARANKLEFHECSDMKTCQFVPAEIHAYFKHYGGRAECRIRDGLVQREWSSK